MALKHHVRNLGAQLFWSLRLSYPRRTAAELLTIVTFHRVLPNPEGSPLPDLAVTPILLRGCLKFFAEHYTCLTVSQAVERFFAGERPARPLLAVTFDDGRKDGFMHALPALRSRNVPATFYVPAGYVDDTSPLWHDKLAWIVRRLEEQGGADALRERIPELGTNGVGATERQRGGLVRQVIRHAKSLAETKRAKLLTDLSEQAGEIIYPFWEEPMSWSELRQLKLEGHEVGSHSMTHTVLRDDLGADQHREIAGSRRLLEENLNGSVTSFCFPTGEYDRTTLRELRTAGYQNAVTTQPGPNVADTDRFELRRIDIQEHLNANRRGEARVPVLAWRLSQLPGTPG